MDPDATLKEINILLAQALVGTNAQQAQEDLVYEVDKLLSWLASGGFPPDWTKR